MVLTLEHRTEPCGMNVEQTAEFRLKTSDAGSLRRSQLLAILTNVHVRQMWLVQGHALRSAVLYHTGGKGQRESDSEWRWQT
jgi:hypothetical protein